MTKNLLFVPFRNGLTLGIELAKMPLMSGEVSMHPSHFYVHRADGTYLGFACFGCHGEDGKVRAEVCPPDEELGFGEGIKFFDDLVSAVDWLDTTQ